MRITTKGQLAVMVLVDLAACSGDAPVPLWGISERQKISVSYLEQLFRKLSRRKIVKSIRGPGGGYYLARPGSQITVDDIISAVDESMDVASYKQEEETQDGHPCSTATLWHGLNRMCHAYLSTVNVQQLVDTYLQEKKEATPMTRSSPTVTRSTTTHPQVSL